MTRPFVKSHNKKWSQNVIDKPIHLSLFISSGKNYNRGHQLSPSLKDQIQKLQSKDTQNGSLISNVTRLTTFSQSVGSPRFNLRRATEPVLLLGQDCIYRTKLVTGPRLRQYISTTLGKWTFCKTIVLFCFVSEDKLTTLLNLFFRI